VQGIGISVKVWLNITGNMDGDNMILMLTIANIISVMQLLSGKWIFLLIKAGTYNANVSVAACGHWRRYRQQ
jgi:hypothetical protein